MDVAGNELADQEVKPAALKVTVEVRASFDEDIKAYLCILVVVKR